MKKIFISYSWDNDEHVSWTKKLADELDSYNEFHIIFDRYDLNSITDKNYFMESGIFESDLVLVVCTEKYAFKANNRKAGVGIETHLNAIRHWEESDNGKSSKTIVIAREDRKKSIPNYLKAKLSLNFKDDDSFNENVSTLIEEIKKVLFPVSLRPEKSKSIKKRPMNNFQFDRVDDILAINYKKREKLESVTDFKAGNKIKYEYWKTKQLNLNSSILILFNNINIKDTIERFIFKNEKRIPRSLIVFRAHKGEKDYIQKIFHEHKIKVRVVEYTIASYFWNECLDQEWKNENRVLEEEFFMDQRVYKLIGEKKETQSLSLEYIDTFLNNDTEHSIQLLFASGGMGKSTLSQVLTNKINDECSYDSKKQEEKKAILIQSEMIRNSLRKDSIRNFEIKNLFQLYDNYSKIISENKSLLTQKQFELGILTGKIVVVIDGLDEIITLFHHNFYLEDFIKSLNELNKQLGKTKIIITSRINILQNNQYLIDNPDIDIIYLKGFEDDIWRKYADNRFSKYPNTNKYIKRVEKYITSLTKMTDETDKIILPFFLDLISEVVEEEITESKDFFEVSMTINDYLTNGESIDYIIYSILKREITRQKLEINIVKYVTFFKELSVNYGDKISFKDFKYFIEVYFDSNDVKAIYEKMLLNPLIKVNTDLKFITFKYDFLGNYFATLYMIDIISSNKTIIDQNFIKVISKAYDGKSDILTDLSKYFSSRKEQCITFSKKTIALISQELLKDDSNIQYKHTISSLLYLNQIIYGELSRDKRIDIIKKLYSENKLERFYVWSDFYPLDFSGLQIWSCEFHEYTSFSKSKFKDSKFYHSLFSNITIEAKCDLSKDNFDLESCTLGDIETYINEIDNKETEKMENLEKEFIKFCRNFFNGVNFESKLEENITISPKLNAMQKNIIDFFIGIDLLEREEKLTKKYYKINDSYHRSIKNMNQNNHFSPQLKGILLKISDR